MSDEDGSPAIEHPRATWIDPSSGAPLDQRALFANIATRQVALLGERHDVAEIHRWQLHVATCLHMLRPNLRIGFEMFPRRVQPALDRWVEGALTTDEFIVESEWERVWGFDFDLYAPLFHFCRQQRVPMIALNCERPLVTRVGVEGWDAIPVEERDGLTPAAPASSEHRRRLFAMVGGAGRSGPFGATSPDDPAFDRFVRAQQCWDRAFACNIARVLHESADPPLIVGVIGRGHLEYDHGTPFQLRDLGVEDVAILLPSDQPRHDARRLAGVADALFRLDSVEPPAPRRAKPRPADAQP